MDWTELIVPPTESVQALLAWMVPVLIWVIIKLWRAWANSRRAHDLLRDKLIEKTHGIPRSDTDEG